MRVFCFHSVPRNILYILDEEYPANEPINTNNKMNAVVKEPRLAGDNKPPIANAKVARNIKHNWVPEPTNTLKSMAWLAGGRNTSPWTNFHPDSSLASSTLCVSRIASKDTRD